MFIGQEGHYYMVNIAYFSELNLQFCHFAQKQRICCKNSNYAHAEIFCSCRKAANKQISLVDQNPQNANYTAINVKLQASPIELESNQLV